MDEGVLSNLAYKGVVVKEIPILDYSYVVDDLAILDATEQAGTPKPKGWFKYLMAQVSGRAYWDDKLSRRITRLVNILTHISVCALIYFVFGHNNVSLLASLLFLIHPCNTEVSIWISGKYYGFTTLFVLLAWSCPLLSVFFLTPFACINSLAFPLVFLLKPNFYNLTSLLFLYTLWQRFKWVFIDKKDGKIFGYEHNKYVSSIGWHKVVIALKFYGYYLINNIFALKFCFYQSYMDDYADTQEGIEKGKKIDFYFWVGCAGVTAFLLGCVLCMRQPNSPPNLLFLGFFWATVNFAMWSNFVNVGQQYIANRQVYLANVGLCLSLAYILSQFPLILGLFLGWYFRQFLYAVEQYQNVYWHLFYQVLNEPKFYYSWILLGNLNFARGNFKSAGSNYQQALTLRPNNFKALFNLSSAWLALGRMDKTIDYFERARKADRYGQEIKSEGVIKDRMVLINRFVSAKGNLKLKIEDISTIS